MEITVQYCGSYCTLLWKLLYGLARLLEVIVCWKYAKGPLSD